jgi:hypothetical protein
MDWWRLLIIAAIYGALSWLLRGNFEDDGYINPKEGKDGASR